MVEAGANAPLSRVIRPDAAEMLEGRHLAFGWQLVELGEHFDCYVSVFPGLHDVNKL